MTSNVQYLIVCAAERDDASGKTKIQSAFKVFHFCILDQLWMNSAATAPCFNPNCTFLNLLVVRAHEYCSI